MVPIENVLFPTMLKDRNRLRFPSVRLHVSSERSDFALALKRPVFNSMEGMCRYSIWGISALPFQHVVAVLPFRNDHNCVFIWIPCEVLVSGLPASDQPVN